MYLGPCKSRWLGSGKPLFHLTSSTYGSPNSWGREPGLCCWALPTIGVENPAYLVQIYVAVALGIALRPLLFRLRSVKAIAIAFRFFVRAARQAFISTGNECWVSLSSFIISSLSLGTDYTHYRVSMNLSPSA